MTKISLAAATAEVAARDATLAGLVELIGPLRYPQRSPDGRFAALARAIIFQQLAGRAAQAILGRVVTAIGGRLTAEALTTTPDENLREAGLSRNKLASLRDLSAKVLDGTVELNPNARHSDERIIAALTTVRGIGRWTAQMFLLFELRRLDVWPADDLGVRQGYAAAWKLNEVPTARQLAPLGDPFRPYRSIVARYCWEAAARLKNGTDPSLR